MSALVAVEACERCGSDDLARFGLTQERTDADLTDVVECAECGWSRSALSLRGSAERRVCVALRGGALYDGALDLIVPGWRPAMTALVNLGYVARQRGRTYALTGVGRLALESA